METHFHYRLLSTKEFIDCVSYLPLYVLLSIVNVQATCTMYLCIGPQCNTSV